MKGDKEVKVKERIVSSEMYDRFIKKLFPSSYRAKGTDITDANNRIYGTKGKIALFFFFIVG